MEVMVAVEGYVWEGRCSAVKVDVGVVDEVGHGCFVVIHVSGGTRA
jgi:hypothetical protein